MTYVKKRGGGEAGGAGNPTEGRALAERGGLGLAGAKAAFVSSQPPQQLPTTCWTLCERIRTAHTKFTLSHREDHILSVRQNKTKEKKSCWAESEEPFLDSPLQPSTLVLAGEASQWWDTHNVYPGSGRDADFEDNPQGRIRISCVGQVCSH